MIEMSIPGILKKNHFYFLLSLPSAECPPHTPGTFYKFVGLLFRKTLEKCRIYANL